MRVDLRTVEHVLLEHLDALALGLENRLEQHPGRRIRLGGLAAAMAPLREGVFVDAGGTSRDAPAVPASQLGADGLDQLRRDGRRPPTSP